jgi:hypothetical protein
VWEGLNAVAASVSAIASCVAAYFAASALKQSAASKREDFLEARPLFTFTSFGFSRPTVSKALSLEKEVLDPRAGVVTGYIRNSGRRAAANFSGFIFVLPYDERQEVRAFPIGIGDDALPGTEWNVASGHIRVIPDDFLGSNVARHNDPGFLVAIAVTYDDPIANESHGQISFMRWPGISDNVVSGVLVAATLEEKSRALQRHADLFAPFYVAPPNISLKRTNQSLRD